MLNLIICEDNDVYRSRVKDIAENTIIKDELDINIALCTSFPNDVVKYLDENSDVVGIYILDVDLKSSINGIKLASKIREKDPYGFIIFCTTHSEMSFMTFQYKVEAMDYIIKDNLAELKERISSCILKAYNTFNMNKNTDEVLTIESEDRVMHIKTDDILFIETSDVPHRVKLHEINRQIEFYGTLKEMEEKLDDNFYRCHKAFLVNKKKIKEVDKLNRVIYMINGEQCYVSVRYLRGLIK